MKVVWYARTREIERMGPFDSQVIAFRAMRLCLRPGETLASPPRYPPDLLVWPEEEHDR